MKKFSILIPSRGRINELLDMIESFALLSSVKHEYIVRMDDDDPYSHFLAERSKNVKVIVGPRYGGYKDNHRFIEEAAKHATGDFLMQCVDTAEMLTPEWDRIYEETIQGNDIAVVASNVVDSNNRPAFPWSFPLITRRLYELTGEFCLGQNPSVDRCWEAFAKEMDCGIIAPVQIAHIERRGSVLQDKTAEESLQFYAELNQNWANRCAEFERIGRQYADKVRGKIK